MSNRHIRKYLGFSLLEMAIVLSIVSLLLAGLLPAISSQIEQQRRTETRKLLDEVRDSLIGFAMSNGRLPAPACGTIPTLPGAANNAGIELIPASAALCATGAGDIAVLPWATLGVNETDAWGNRLTYRVTPLFASGVTPGTAASFQLASLGDMTIKESAGGNNVATNIPVVVISHGAMACGAYQPTGARVDELPAASYCQDNDQQENADGDAIFVSKTSPTTTFDDFVIWLSTNILVNRMVAVGKLP